MNGLTFFVAVLALAFMIAIPWAFAADRLDDWDEVHLMHGPSSGCLECLDK